MKIRHATILLPLILLVGCAFNGENQSRELDLKGLCTEEQIFQYEDFNWGTDTEEIFKQSSLNFDEKDLGQIQDSAKYIQVKRNFLLKMQKRTWIWNFLTIS